jgi:hypothetical protein
VEHSNNTANNTDLYALNFEQEALNLDSATKLEPMIKDRITHIILKSWQNEDTCLIKLMIDSFLSVWTIVALLLVG